MSLTRAKQNLIDLTLIGLCVLIALVLAWPSTRQVAHGQVTQPPVKIVLNFKDGSVEVCMADNVAFDGTPAVIATGVLCDEIFANGFEEQ